MRFGLACEGITDQITLENILCGYFDSPELDEDINYLQPDFDETDQKQISGGGWPNLFKYLKIKSFRDAVVSHDFIIIQIDTDVSQDPGFNVNWTDKNNQPISTEDLIKAVTSRLISKIDEGEPYFYQKHATKIIFAVNLHSLECWLVALHSDHTEKEECYDIIKNIMRSTQIGTAKNKRNYDRLSEPFLQRTYIDEVSQKDISFKLFIRNLEELTKNIELM